MTNIYLDALDKELEQHSLSFCRYADDIVIFVGSERSGERILTSITLEERIKRWQRYIRG